MKYSLILILIMMFTSNPLWTQTRETKKPLGIEVSAELLSRFMWRGYDLNHKYGVIQPSITYQAPFLKGLSGGVWASYGLAKKKNLGDRNSSVDEIDWTIGYEFDVIKEKFNLQFAFQRYDYLSKWASWQKTNNRDYEVSATASVFIHEFAVPYIQYARGLDAGIKGNYFEFGVGGYYQFSKEINIGPTIAVAISNQFGQDNQLTHLAILFPLTYTIEKVDFVPSLNVHWRFKGMGVDAYNQKGLIVHAGVQAVYRF
jgi:hypothetical protein